MGVWEWEKRMRRGLFAVWDTLRTAAAHRVFGCVDRRWASFDEDKAVRSVRTENCTATTT